MKNYTLPLIALIFITTEVFGGTDGTGIKIHLAVQTNSVAWDATHTSASFMCRATIENASDDSLTVTNLFQDHSGLSLKVTDQDGNELSRLYSAPFQRESFTIAAGTKASFWPYYGIMNHFSLPKGHTTIGIQLDGKLIGSSYAGSVTSNIVMLNVP